MNADLSLVLWLALMLGLVGAALAYSRGQIDTMRRVGQVDEKKPKE